MLALSRLRMNCSVNFQHQFRFRTIEVHKVSSNRMLPSKSIATHPLMSQPLP